MDWTTLIGPAAIAAAVSGVIAVIGMLVNRATTIKVNRDKITADTQLAERKFAFDKELAERRFAYDRQQAIFKRQFELAEQVLADAYRFKELMNYVRSGVSLGGEGQTRKSRDNEPEDMKRTRDNYFVPVERLQKESEFLGSMMARKDACRAHFGSNAERAFNAFHTAVHHVRVASSMLVDMADDDHPNTRDLKKELQNDIWAPMAKYAGEDKIGDKIDEGVALIEEFCRPVLEQSGS